jgi:hypothetical protein
MVACTAGFDRDHCRRKLLEECEHLLASQLLLQNRLLGDVHSVKLENVLRRIHSNSANLFHGRLPLSEIYSDLILALLMPSGAVHTNRITRGFRARLAISRHPRRAGPVFPYGPARSAGREAELAGDLGQAHLRARVGVCPQGERSPPTAEMAPFGCHVVANLLSLHASVRGLTRNILTSLVRTAGLEPAPSGEEQILSLLRLPFRHVRLGRPARANFYVRAATGR